MAPNESASSFVVRRTRTKYHWPATPLNVWLVVMIAGSLSILGIFSSFVFIQRQLQIGIPWFFTYWITVGTLSAIFLFAMLGLIAQRQLLPGIVMMGSFILFILWMIGLVVISLELWGPSGNVNTNCQLYIENHSVSGASLETLAWLQQHGICKSSMASSLGLPANRMFLSRLDNEYGLPRISTPHIRHVPPRAQPRLDDILEGSTVQTD
ncbi:hypothetical protein GcM3_186024 [Golovinomyces cichoracearum]|uniref:Uncharacterized protein n=1 Tax=Golovinomyces cichoracearum TaxID=62708 RepID=A0A420HJW4_9PEZI|nr:hypothetical protein GcM3_186024 [Golovinomyces cichoracearum]